MGHHFVRVPDLVSLMAGTEAVRLLDVRWRLDRPTEGPGAYADGHIPGAVFVDMERDLAAHGTPQDGRHPLPSREVLQAAAQRWGLRRGDTVVIYDDSKGLAASRAWWLLRQYGVEARVLDGGLAAWRRAGHPLETGTLAPAPGDLVLDDPRGDDLSIDEAAAFPAHGVLIDARAPERYRGETEPLDPVAGHIPGAVNLPMATLLDAEGMLRDESGLRDAFAALGVDSGTSVAAYCGSGITAAHTALVLAELDIDAKVFPGSWSQWSNTPGRPVATGPTPQGEDAP